MPAGAVRPDPPPVWRRVAVGRVAVAGPLLADAGNDALIVHGPRSTDVTFVDAPALLPRLAFRSSAPLSAIGSAGDTVFVLAQDGSLRRFTAGGAADVPLTGPGPFRALAVRDDLVARGGRAGVVALSGWDGTRLRRAATLVLGSTAVRALAFGRGEAARYLYVALTGVPEVVVVDTELAGGPAVVARRPAPAATAIAAGAAHLFLVPAESDADVAILELQDPRLPRLDLRLPLANVVAVTPFGDGFAVQDDAGRLAVYRPLASGNSIVHQSVNQ